MSGPVTVSLHGPPDFPIPGGGFDILFDTPGLVIPLPRWLDSVIGNNPPGTPSMPRQSYDSWLPVAKSDYDAVVAAAINDFNAGGPNLFTLTAALNGQLDAIYNALDQGFDSHTGKGQLEHFWLTVRVILWTLRKYGLGANQFWADWIDLLNKKIKSLPPNVGKSITALQLDLKGVHTWMDQVGPWILRIPGVVTQVNAHQSQLVQITTVDLPALRKAQADLSTTLNTRVVPQLTTLQLNFNALNAYTRNTLTLRVDTAFASIADVKKFIDVTVWPRVQKNTTDISVIFGRIVNLDMAKIDKALLDLNNLQVLVIPQITSNVAHAQADIKRIGEPLPVQQTLQSLSARITADEALKAQSIIPSIQRLQDAVQGLQSVMQGTVLPAIANLVQDVATLWQTIRDGILPHLTLIDTSVKTIQDTITNIITPQLVTFTTFMTNITTTVVNIVKTNCEEIRRCLEQGKKEHPQTACEEGRSWWGIWAECWLDPNTPDISFADAWYQGLDPFVTVIQDFHDATEPQPMGTWGSAVTAAGRVFHAIAEHSLVPVEMPHVADIVDPGYIYTPQP